MIKTVSILPLKERETKQYNVGDNAHKCIAPFICIWGDAS